MHEHDVQRGFTLIELMVVILILGGLVTLVGVHVLGTGDDADRRLAKTQLHLYAQVVDHYILRYRKAPNTLEDLKRIDPDTGEPLMRTLPVDPWGNPYEMDRLDDRTVRLRSLGRDGAPDTEDDIVWPDEPDA